MGYRIFTRMIQGKPKYVITNKDTREKYEYNSLEAATIAIRKKKGSE